MKIVLAAAALWLIYEGVCFLHRTASAIRIKRSLGEAEIRRIIEETAGVFPEKARLVMAAAKLEHRYIEVTGAKPDSYGVAFVACEFMEKYG